LLSTIECSPKRLSGRRRDLSMKVVVLSMLALAGALELTPDNWDKETAGKTVFIKFLAPW